MATNAAVAASHRTSSPVSTRVTIFPGTSGSLLLNPHVVGTGRPVELRLEADAVHRRFRGEMIRGPEQRHDEGFVDGAFLDIAEQLATRVADWEQVGGVYPRQD